MTDHPDGSLKTQIPDLRDIPLGRLAELGGSALADAVALYRERLKGNGLPLSSSNARIQAAPAVSRPRQAR